MEIGGILGTRLKEIPLVSVLKERRTTSTEVRYFKAHMEDSLITPEKARQKAADTV